MPRLCLGAPRRETLTAKRSYPLSKVYGLLEPGPVLLMTTAEAGRANVMTLSWTTMMEFEPPLVGCGNVSGRRVDKFRRFGLTPVPAREVAPPLIAECYASLECRLADHGWVNRHNSFVREVVKAWGEPGNPAPRTLHHRGRGGDAEAFVADEVGAALNA